MDTPMTLAMTLVLVSTFVLMVITFIISAVKKSNEKTRAAQQAMINQQQQQQIIIQMPLSSLRRPYRLLLPHSSPQHLQRQHLQRQLRQRKAILQSSNFPYNKEDATFSVVSSFCVFIIRMRATDIHWRRP